MCLLSEPIVVVVLTGALCFGLTRACFSCPQLAGSPAVKFPFAVWQFWRVSVALAQKHGCKYFETSAIRNDQVPEAFSSLIARIVAQIPNPPEPSLLLRKRIQIGKSLAENKSFRAALFDLAPA